MNKMNPFLSPPFLQNVGGDRVILNVSCSSIRTEKMYLFTFFEYIHFCIFFEFVFCFFVFKVFHKKIEKGEKV
jgi:hypothetical protein